MISYDVDGVLATGPPPRDKPFMYQNKLERDNYKQIVLKWYESAPPLLTPTEPFVAITARKDEPIIRSITETWLNKYYKDNLKGLYMLDTSKTYNNVAIFKAKIINNHNISAHVEDNMIILKKLKKLVHNTKLYYWESGMTHPKELYLC